MKFGIGEILLVSVVILLLFGRGRIAQVMGEFGKGLRSFKDGLKDGDKDKQISSDKKESAE